MQLGMTHHRFVISDQLWQRIAPLLPGMDVQIFGHRPVNLLQEGEELLMWMAVLAAPAHCRWPQPGQRTRHYHGDPFPMAQCQRQHGLGSLQSLDLLLLIHAEDDGMIRWSQVETHPLLHLIYKIGIVGDLEMPSVMGL